MTKNELRNHYGSGAKAAKAVGFTRAWFCNISDPVPRQWAAYYQLITGGKLKSGIVKQ